MRQEDAAAYPYFFEAALLGAEPSGAPVPAANPRARRFRVRAESLPVNGGDRAVQSVCQIRRPTRGASFHFALLAWTARQQEMMRSPSK